MFITRIIVIVLVITVVIEGMFLHVLLREYRKQALKEELLTKIIEERFSKHGKDFDNG